MPLAPILFAKATNEHQKILTDVYEVGPFKIGTIGIRSRILLFT